MIAGLSLWYVTRKQNEDIETAHAHATASHEKDLLYRQWNDRYGGVYVPVCDDAQTDPGPADLEQHVTTTSGRALTLVNSAHMARQVHQLGEQQGVIAAHVASLKPLDPRNAPDDWEKRALQGLEDGQSEIYEIQQIGDRSYARMMWPFRVEERCLTCHREQGYEVGDIRGGITVSVPVESFCELSAAVLLGNGLVWLIGLAGIILGGRRLAGYFRQREQDLRALRQSHEQLQTVIDGIPSPIMAIDRNYKIVLANRFVHELAGGIDPVARGLTCHRVYHHRDTPCESSDDPCPLRLAVKEERNIKVTHTHYGDDGEERVIDVLGTPVFDDSGEVRQIIEIGYDVTDRIRAQDALEDAKLAAEAASRTKSEFLANMSHEIRTPMTAILGFADVLLSNVKTPEDVEAAKTVKRNGEYLLTIINDILDLSKIESGKLQLEQLLCSPARIVEEITALMRIRGDAKGLPLSVEYAGPIPETITTDPTRLQQVLTNLVGNAVKFTETGSVRIVTRLDENAEGGPKLQCDVVDTGIGMTPQQLDKLFQAFTQGDMSTSRKFGGTGLGLAISKRLAELMGGDIAVTSTPGKGTTFRLTVAAGPLDGVARIQPATETASPATPSAQTAERPRTKLDCRVLLVEDGPDNQRLISVLLKKRGAEVTLAENGQVAVDMVLTKPPGSATEDKHRSEPFDVILMDMQMPVMDGYEATARLRQQGYRGPIVALTAHAMSYDRQKCLDAGCNDYLTKPIDREKLVETVARYADPAPDGAATDIREASPTETKRCNS